MIWPWRVVIVVPIASVGAAEIAARAINSTGPGYLGDAFTSRLSATGQEPATHAALYTSATDEMVAAMSNALPQISGAMYWRHDTGYQLVASNVSNAIRQPWCWSDSLAAAGLAEIQTSLMGPA
jgi:hypothetical protein